jgi:peptidoglycan/LPS O-acetylase OafA/YrhL
LTVRAVDEEGVMSLGTGPAASREPTLLPPGQQASRVEWLDGARALAAMYVVLHHVWIRVWSGYPNNDGPTWAGWLVPGQLGVVVFIVVSGYSLSVRPARHGGRLPEGKRGFARRRAWRILPPYWAALVISTLVVDLVLAQQTGVRVDLKSFLVNALLLQDIVSNTTPNGAFWSIAIEAQIYLLFPLILWAVRRWSTVAVTFALAGLVSAAHLVSIWQPAFRKIEDLTPQLFLCFALGVAAATARASSATKRQRPRWPAAAVAILTVAWCWWAGTATMVAQFFWVDIAVGLATALLFWSLSTRPARIGAFLAWKPIRLLGEFSYSIYLIHAPILGMVFALFVRKLPLSPVAQFLLTLSVGVPVALICAYCFFWVMERPFLTIRSWQGLRGWMRLSRSPHVGVARADRAAAAQLAATGTEAQTERSET